MKKGWEYIALSSVCRVQNGFAFNSKLFNDSNNGLPLIRIRDIKRGYSLTYTDEICSEDFFVEDGDMLIGMDGDFNIGEWKGGHALLNQRVCKLIPSEKVLAKFIFYFIPEALQKINDKTAFSTVKHLSSKQVNTILLPNLSLSEQQSIVDYLDSAFAKIDAMKANAEKALNEAKALFQASLKEMLEPKEGWEEKKLGDICNDIKYGTSIPSNENGEYKYLRMNNITNDGFLDVSHYKTITLPEKELEKCLVKKGDIIFNRTNSRELVGKSCVFTEEENMVIAGYLIRIRLKEGFEPQFITYSMNLQRSLGLFQHLIVGAVHQANISANNIQKVLINYPILSEQQIIVEALDSLKSKVDRLQANYEKISQECDALKQAILRQVFE